MARQDINRGSAANDGTGDTLYAAGGKINANFTELYSQFDAREVVPVLSTSGGSAAANGAALAAAVATARSANGYVRLPAGRYPMTCALTTGAIIEFSPETVLLQEQNAAVLSIDLSGSAVGPHTITAFTLTKHTNNAGASTNKFLRLTMSPTDAANYAVGDAIMVSSQDARTYYTGNTNYAGEMAFVTAVEAGSGYVYVDGGLWLHGVGTLFTTTPVARRLARDTVRLIRPQVEANGDVYSTIVGGSWPGAIELKAVPRPQIEGLRINSAWGIGLYFKSCAAFRVTNFRIADCPGDPANNRYGYGILARGACNAGQIVDGYIERTRHGITTDCREAASWAIGNVWDHGDCTDLVVDGVVAASNGAPPFDTHENSVNTTFRNCHAVGARYSTQGITGATGYGFNLRGPYDKVINCEASDCEGGVDVAATGLIHEIVGENVIDGFTFRGEATNNLAGHGIVIDGNAAETTPQRVSVRNLRASVGSRGVLVSAGYTGRLMFEGCTFRGFLDTQVRVQASCTIDMVNCHIDMTEAGTGELCISVDNSNTVALNLANVTLRTKNATTPVAVVNTAAGATSNIRHSNVTDVNGAVLAIATGSGTNNVTRVSPVNEASLSVATFAELSSAFGYAGSGKAKIVAAGDRILLTSINQYYTVLDTAAATFDLNYTGTSGVKLSVIPGERGFNVLAFGAKGDRTTDDSDAFAAAVTASTRLAFTITGLSNNVIGPTIYVPKAAGYRIAQPRKFMPDLGTTRWVGLTYQGDAGSPIFFDYNGDDYLCYNNNSFLVVKFADLVFTCNSDLSKFIYSTAAGGAQDYTFENCLWAGTWQKLFVLRGANNNSEWKWFGGSVGASIRDVMLDIADSDQFLNFWFYGMKIWLYDGQCVRASAGGHIKFFGCDWSGLQGTRSLCTSTKGKYLFELTGVSHARGVCDFRVIGGRFECKTNGVDGINARILYCEWNQGNIEFSADCGSTVISEFDSEYSFWFSRADTPGPHVNIHDSVLVGKVKTQTGLTSSWPYPNPVVISDTTFQSLVHDNPAALVEALTPTNVLGTWAIKLQRCNCSIARIRASGNDVTTVVWDVTIGGQRSPTDNDECVARFIGSVNSGGGNPLTTGKAFLVLPPNCVITSVTISNDGAGGSGHNCTWQVYDETAAVALLTSAANRRLNQIWRETMPTPYRCPAGILSLRDTAAAGINTSSGGFRAEVRFIAP